MKSFRGLLPHLALFLAQVAVSQPGPSLLAACEELSIGHNDGVLSGKCRGAGHPMLTSLDLDQCLGWGPRAVPLGLRGSTTAGLAPEKDGAFTEYCSPCYIANKGQRGQDVAHLLCNCGPDDSDISTEYSVDLGGLVTITNEGCLQCMGSTGDCVREAPPSWTGRGASAGTDFGRGLIGLPGREGKRVPCEESITDPIMESLLPSTYPNTTHHRCRQEHTLCCYQTPARRSRMNTWFEAFSLIQGRNRIWRLHFVIDKISLEITGQLSRVVQFCSPLGMEECEGETQPDKVPDLPDDDTGANYLEDSENIVYDEDGIEDRWEPTHVTDAWGSIAVENPDWTTPLPKGNVESSSRAPVRDFAHVVAAVPRR